MRNARSLVHTHSWWCCIIDNLHEITGLFPTYRDSPLKSRFNRILAVGDASGIQSPLSFGGFGSLTRHIERIIGYVRMYAKKNVRTLSKQHLVIVT